MTSLRLTKRNSFAPNYFITLHVFLIRNTNFHSSLKLYMSKLNRVLTSKRHKTMCEKNNIAWNLSNLERSIILFLVHFLYSSPVFLFFLGFITAFVIWIYKNKNTLQEKYSLHGHEHNFEMALIDHNGEYEIVKILMIRILTYKNTFWCCAYVDPSTHSWSGSKTGQPQVKCLGIYIKGQNSFQILLFVWDCFRSFNYWQQYRDVYIYEL